MTDGFSEGAHWLGMLVSDMTREDFIHVLHYKIRELRYCYMVMTHEQALAVTEKMKNVPIPIRRGES